MVSTSTPARSLIQRMEALQRGNEVRSRRAQLKRDMKAGHKAAIDVLLDPPEWLATMKVFDLLLAMPKQGRVKVNEHLSQCRISPSKTVDGLSDRQRTALVARLRLRNRTPVVKRPRRPVSAETMAHLTAANTIRLRRSGLSGQIASGELTVAELLLEPPRPEMMTWPLGEMLACQRRWGETRVRKLLWACQISEIRPVGALTERQRRLLARLLDAVGEMRVAA